MRVFNALTILLLACASVNAGEPIIVDHRGASRNAPENTIPAFRLAWEQGADAIEGDFHLTKDRQIVCIHDGETKKVANTNLVIRNSTLADLKKVDVGIRKGTAFQGTRIPTIGEVFSTIQEEKKIYIEIKCGTEIIPALLREIDKSGLTKEQIVIISFKEKVLRKLKAKAPQYKVSWLCKFKKNKKGETTPSLEKVLNALKAIQADGLSSSTAVPHSVIEAVREHGYEWHVWTVNNPGQAMKMTTLGAKSITTDVPGKLKKILSKQK